LILFTMFRLMLVNVSLLLLQFEKCIANDICDGDGALFFTFPPAGSTNKRVGKVCLTFLPNLVILICKAFGGINAEGSPRERTSREGYPYTTSSTQQQRQQQREGGC
jgi:hypothetical protein